MKNKFQKTIKYFLYTLLALVFLSGCSNTGNDFSMGEWGNLAVNAMNRGQLLFVIVIGSAIGSQVSR